MVFEDREVRDVRRVPRAPEDHEGERKVAGSTRLEALRRLLESLEPVRREGAEEPPEGLLESQAEQGQEEQELQGVISPHSVGREDRHRPEQEQRSTEP